MYLAMSMYVLVHTPAVANGCRHTLPYVELASYQIQQ